MLKVKFIGATQGVTGSCSWLWHTESDTQLLIDCGLNQGRHEDEWHNYQDFEFNPKEIKYVLLTHAHIDHCGLLPKLIQGGFKGWVYCTQATRDLAKVMLADTANNSDLFTRSEVDAIKWVAIDAHGFYWNKLFRLGDGLSATFKRNSHVLGSCAISIAWEATPGIGTKGLKNIYFSGDIGCQTEDNPYLPLLKDDHAPYPSADYIVIESTYGGRNRPSEYKDAEARVERLGQEITRTVFEKGGRVLIPAFSFHRTHELIMDLYWWQTACWEKSDLAHYMGTLQEKPNGKHRYENPLCVLVESPLSAKLNEIYARELRKKTSNGKFQYLNNQLPDRLGISAHEVGGLFEQLADQNSLYNAGHLISYGPKTEKKRKAQTDQEKLLNNHVILASSGMCDHGAAARFLKLMRNDPRNTILLTGFQASGSAGGHLQKQAKDGTQSAMAEVVDLSAYYSGHADQQKLLDYAFCLGTYAGDARPATIFINHGETSQKQQLREQLLSRASETFPGDRPIDNVLIANRKWFDLDSGKFIEEHEFNRDIEELFAKLCSEVSGIKNELDLIRNTLPR
ncbi:MBL fold metallo-hydrolase [Motiliproteus sediminis]|uniref:MBL fold metallo-hydrolase n=1 Tax=Motiliproteus sediminis TaxID=1468178 RepID=UPI001AF01D2E|nr:MBL fold metallo-hydrolase [Motiliproteus sediminis]